MLRSTFTVAAKPGTTDEQIQLFITKLREVLDGKIPGMTNFHVGRNLGFFDKKAAIVVTADFSDRRAFDKYITQPAHLRVGKKYGDWFDRSTMYTTQIDLDD